MEIVFILIIGSIAMGLLILVFRILSFLFGFSIGIIVRLFDNIMEHCYYKLYSKLSTLSYIAKKQEEVKEYEEAKLTMRKVHNIAIAEKKYLQEKISFRDSVYFTDEHLHPNAWTFRYMVSAFIFARYELFDSHEVDYFSGKINSLNFYINITDFGKNKSVFKK